MHLCVGECFFWLKTYGFQLRFLYFLLTVCYISLRYNLGRKCNLKCTLWRKRRRERVGDWDPPSDHWPSLMLSPTFFASTQTPPVSLLTSSEEGRSMATKPICGLRQVGFGIDAAGSERIRHRNGGKLGEGCNAWISVSHHSFQ